VFIIATDSGQLSSTATAQVTVLRNLLDPSWGRSDYTGQVFENAAPGTQVLTLTASDGDTQSPHNALQFTISSINNNNAANYFEILSSGALLVRSSLVGTIQPSFSVSFILLSYNFSDSPTNSQLFGLSVCLFSQTL